MWVDRRGSEIVPMGECLRLLAVAAKRGDVGRLAVSQAHAPIVEPVNFAYRDRRVLVRLGDGSLARAATGNLVAFEIDHLDRRAGHAWSVVVRGLALEVDGSERLGDLHVAPVPLVPAPGDRVLAVRLDVVTGRRFRLRDGCAQAGDPASAQEAAPHPPAPRPESVTPVRHR